MARGRFIAGDWGTSRLRLHLCGEDSTILDSRIGPGALAARDRHEQVLDAEIAAWVAASGDIPVILCGMVGSSIGWVETPYVPCPADPAALAGQAMALRNGRVQIVPGLRCRNRHGAPDVMRGEETQVLGALETAPALQRGRQLLCLPGTHTKWVLVEDGAIVEFLTAPVGELYDLLSKHSLVAPAPAGRFDDAVFAAAVTSIRQHPDAELLQRLFECRSRRLSGELAADAVGSYLSGLLIGSDVAGALRLFTAGLDQNPVALIGAADLVGPYSAALGAYGTATIAIDGDTASIAGLGQIHHRLFHRGAVRAAG